MKLIKKDQYERLLKNGAKDFSGNHVPVVKWFNPVGAAMWLVSAIDPEDPDIAWCIADLGFDCVEAGTVSISEVEGITLNFGLKIERDIHFNPQGKRLYEFLEAHPNSLALV